MVGDGVHLSGVGDVGDLGACRAAAVGDLGDERAQARFAPGCDHDPGALFGEAQCRGPTDAARRSHHDDDLLGQRSRPRDRIAVHQAATRNAAGSPDRRHAVVASLSRPRMAPGASDWGA